MKENRMRQKYIGLGQGRLQRTRERRRGVARADSGPTGPTCHGPVVSFCRGGF
jgi:hypothetical protein